jgi:hypothetical protein
MDYAIPNETGISIDPIKLLKESVRSVVSGIDRQITQFENGGEGSDRYASEQCYDLSLKSHSINKCRLTLPRLFEHGSADPPRGVVKYCRPLLIAQQA